MSEEVIIFDGYKKFSSNIHSDICPECGIMWTENGGDMIQCDNCKRWFHFSCVGIAGGESQPSQFYCETCTYLNTKSKEVHLLKNRKMSKKSFDRTNSQTSVSSSTKTKNTSFEINSRAKMEKNNSINKQDSNLLSNLIGSSSSKHSNSLSSIDASSSRVSKNHTNSDVVVDTNEDMNSFINTYNYDQDKELLLRNNIYYFHHYKNLDHTSLSNLPYSFLNNQQKALYKQNELKEFEDIKPLDIPQETSQFLKLVSDIIENRVILDISEPPKVTRKLSRTFSTSSRHIPTKSSPIITHYNPSNSHGSSPSLQQAGSPSQPYQSSPNLSVDSHQSITTPSVPKQHLFASTNNDASLNGTNTSQSMNTLNKTTSNSIPIPVSIQSSTSSTQTPLTSPPFIPSINSSFASTSTTKPTLPLPVPPTTPFASIPPYSNMPHYAPQSYPFFPSPSIPYPIPSTTPSTTPSSIHYPPNIPPSILSSSPSKSNSAPSISSQTQTYTNNYVYNYPVNTLSQPIRTPETHTQEIPSLVTHSASVTIPLTSSSNSVSQPSNSVSQPSNSMIMSTVSLKDSTINSQETIKNQPLSTGISSPLIIEKDSYIIPISSRTSSFSAIKEEQPAYKSTRFSEISNSSVRYPSEERRSRNYNNSSYSARDSKYDRNDYYYNYSNNSNNYSNNSNNYSYDSRDSHDRDISYREHMRYDNKRDHYDNDYYNSSNNSSSNNRQKVYRSSDGSFKKSRFNDI